MLGLDKNSELSSIDAAWNLSRGYWWDFINFESILFLENLVKCLIQMKSWARCLECCVLFCSRGNGIFWISIYLTYVSQFGQKDLVYDYLFTSQSKSHSIPYMDFFFYNMTYFFPIEVIEDRVTEINSNCFNGTFWPFLLSWLISSIFICSSL